jgi:FSR family fosmidomycin resistance protein-like MFS transporter
MTAAGYYFRDENHRAERGMADTTRRARFGAVMGLIGSGHAVSHLYLLALPPLFPLLQSELGAGITELALLVSLLNLATVGAQFPAGMLVDRIGARPVLAWGLVLMGASFLAMSQASSYWLVMATAVLAGVGNSVFHPANYAIMNASIEEGRMGRAYSIHNFTGNVGFMSAPVLMVLLSGLMGWRGALLATGLLAIAVGLVLGFAVSILRDDQAAGPAGMEAKIEAAPGTAGLLTSAPVLTMFMFYVFIAMGTGGMQSISVAALVAHQGLELETAVWTLEFFLVCAAIGVLLGGPLADRTKRHGALAAVALGVSALLIAPVGAFQMPAALIAVLFALYGVIQGTMRPARDLMTRAITPPGATGRVFGFVTGGLNIGGAISPVLLGWLVDAGHPEAVFYGIGGILLLCVTTVGVARSRPVPHLTAAE